MKKCIRITIEGKVQGVFFRANTREKARMLGIEGYVRNQPDGSVFIEARGEEKALAALTEWCHRGPDPARVTRVSTRECPPDDYNGFEIRK